MHSSRMRTARCIGCVSCHACPLPMQVPVPHMLPFATHAPLPLPCMPPTMHAPYHACPPPVDRQTPVKHDLRKLHLRAVIRGFRSLVRSGHPPPSGKSWVRHCETNSCAKIQMWMLSTVELKKERVNKYIIQRLKLMLRNF